ncbi:MAG: polymer-forming cytoskeletal protein [Bacteroidia bacterium]|nr:polymer-forming cytoskeletal protein [Bacteroidia bacterium]MCZ2278320.1 polymer-forming cytoskeletal protein [Bacteroidia bacterium]
MFDHLKKKETARTSENGNGSVNIISAGTVIEGEIRSAGDIRIDGSIHGAVASKAKIVIGSTGRIDGDIECQNADISGTLNGKAVVAEMLNLKSSAVVNGDILTGKLVVEVGAAFTGNCNMGPMVKDIKHADKQPAAITKEKTA